MDNEELVTREKSEVQVAQQMIVMIMDAARDKSIDIDKLERLMAMQERMVKDQRKTAYVAAMARLQAKLPQINRNGQIIVKEKLRSKYATIEDIDVAIRPLLAEEGFSFSCDQEDSVDKIRKFAGKMSHRDGHEEVKYVRLPFDGSDFRSAVQSEKSTYSYAARILMTMHLNLVTRDVDNDGQNPEFITPEQVVILKTLIAETNADLVAFLKFAKVEALEDIGAKDYKSVLNALETKKRMMSKSETIPPKPETKPPVQETKPGVFEPSPELVAKKWFIRIEQSPTVDMLKRVGELLKVTDDAMSDEDKKTARQLYTARMKQLTNSPQASDAPTGAGVSTQEEAPKPAEDAEVWI